MTPPPADLPRLAPRAAESHKGDFGRLLLVGGARGMAGSISLSGTAALASGAGLVTIATPDICLDVVASLNACYMTLALPSDGDGRLARGAFGRIEQPLGQATVVGCGPGLGTSDGVDEMAARLWREYDGPAVFDADALNSLARQAFDLAEHAGPRVMTPHPGEFARLDGSPIASADQRAERAAKLARRAQSVVVLKGARTVVTDGRRTHTNPTGNPGMATAGTGDVLTGVVTALMGQGLEPLDAARLGAYVHARAGDLAAGELGQISMTARDLLNRLPAAFCEVNAR